MQFFSQKIKYIARNEEKKLHTWRIFEFEVFLLCFSSSTNLLILKSEFETTFVIIVSLIDQVLQQFSLALCCVLLKGVDKKVGSSTSSTLVLLRLFFSSIKMIKLSCKKSSPYQIIRLNVYFVIFCIRFVNSHSVLTFAS